MDVKENSDVARFAFTSGNVSIQKSEIEMTMTNTEMTAMILAYIDEWGYS